MIARDWGGDVRPSGELGLRVIRGGRKGEILLPHQLREPERQIPLAEIVRQGFPVKGLSGHVAKWRCKNLFGLTRGLRRVLLARGLNLATFYGQLYLVKIDGLTGQQIRYGLASMRVVTTAGVNYLASDMNDGGSDINAFDFHGIGTGVAAEAVGDTALGTELTTEYNPNSTRATGSPTNPSANQYRSVGTNTLDSGTPAVTEHGLFTSATVAAGTLWDRSTFSAINLVGANGDGLQSTYTVTFSAGG